MVAWSSKMQSVTNLVVCDQPFVSAQDLPGSLSPEEIRDVLELEKIKTHHWQIVACSAVTGNNLLEGVDWILEDISRRIFTLD